MASNVAKETQFVQVVPLMLLHCPSASEPSTLARLVRVSSQCRAAVQQSQGHLSTLDRVWQLKLKSPAKLVSFLKWVPAHAGLVQHLGLPEPTGADRAIAEAAVTFMLQLCSIQGAVGPAQPQHATTAAAAATGGNAASREVQLPGTATRLPLRLTTFHTAWLHAPAVLEALVATEVQELQLQAISGSALTPGFAASLGRMHSLRVLNINVRHGTNGMPDAVAAAIGRLQQLTRLYCSEVQAEQAVQLPGSLQELNLSCVMPDDRGSGAAPEGLYVLTHLRQLHTLSVMNVGAPGRRLHLGTGVSSLCLVGGLGGVSGGTGLKKVSFAPLWHENGRFPGDFLKDLRQLREPWELEISFIMFEIPPAADANESLQPFVACLGQCTGLTQLHVAAQYVVSAGDVAWCSTVARLPQLKVLQLHCDRLQPDDAFHLSRLTSLTKLDLQVRKGVGDGACVALACCLTGLVDLSIVSRNVMTASVLPALANGPTGLTRLHLGLHKDVVMSDGLMLQLTKLQQLCELRFLGLDRCSTAAQQQLLSAVPSLTTLYWL